MQRRSRPGRFLAFLSLTAAASHLMSFKINTRNTKGGDHYTRRAYAAQRDPEKNNGSGRAADDNNMCCCVFGRGKRDCAVFRWKMLVSYVQVCKRDSLASSCAAACGERKITVKCGGCRRQFKLLRNIWLSIKWWGSCTTRRGLIYGYAKLVLKIKYLNGIIIWNLFHNNKSAAVELPCDNKKMAKSTFLKEYLIESFNRI